MFLFIFTNFPFLVFPVAIDFKHDSLATWLLDTRVIVTKLLRRYSVNFTDISIENSEHDYLASTFDFAFLPRSELETAFADLYVTSEPCSLEKP